MQTKEFHLGDVLSITTGRLVSLRHMEGVYDILNFMTGDDLYTHQLPRASKECKPYLKEQFPQFFGNELASEVAVLDVALKGETDKAGAEKIVTDWLAKQVVKYGEMFAVKPVPTDAHEHIDPVSELVEVMHPSKIIIVNV